MTEIRIGVIGGSGLYHMEGLRVTEERRLETPFGEPSDSYVLGELEDIPVAFLARHARGHRILPSEINFRANIYGFKTLGVESLVSIPAAMSHRSLSPEERERAGVPGTMIRLSVGLEAAADLVEDLDRALHAAAA